jgi:hypothetical protein
MTYEECQELKNIKYKTMLLTGNQKTMTSITNDISNLELLLNNESIINKKETWNRLDKSIKMEKIHDYIETLTNKYTLTTLEKTNLKEYLSTSLDKKSLYKNKDVVYIKESGKLENIPILHFNNTTRKFSLKKSAQHVSTVKSLGPTRKKKSRSNKGKLSNSPRNTEKCKE